MFKRLLHMIQFQPSIERVTSVLGPASFGRVTLVERAVSVLRALLKVKLPFAVWWLSAKLGD